MFKSSFQVFKPSKKLHWLFLILRSYDFSSLSKSLYSEFYSQKKSKNHSYDPSSMLRLLFFIREYLDNKMLRLTKLMTDIEIQYGRLDKGVKKIGAVESTLPKSGGTFEKIMNGIEAKEEKNE